MSVDRVEIRAQVILDQADERWRGVLRELCDEGLTSYALATFFVRTHLEQQGDFAIVRAPNAFAVDWLTKRYRPQVAEQLGLPTSRVLFVLEGLAVELEPEPVEDESA